ncbi:hypothetical protein EYF80_037615 [Liparis tanakae]|uniref:Uncharacterized protein n=1 Tax=Liparis tanakae TaxID=230148 RepID=A0A4Z2GGB4_9TELE|nr:hypothetical protein EYF80_037615 [Liparis tanakae]
MEKDLSNHLGAAAERRGGNMSLSAPSFSSPGCGADGSSRIFWIWCSSSLGDSSRPAVYTHRRKKRPLWYTATNSLSCQCWSTSVEEEVEVIPPSSDHRIISSNQQDHIE